MTAMKTPDWIIEGYDSKEEYEKIKRIKPGKKKAKTFKVKKCPECGGTEVGVILSGEEGGGSNGWECKGCNWAGKNPEEKEMSENEFIKHFDKKEGK